MASLHESLSSAPLETFTRYFPLPFLPALPHVVLVWDFIRTCHIPYCSLYDDGYTSIGLKHNTHRHEALRVVSASSSEQSLSDYLPAYHLTDGDDERVSRTENPPPVKAPPSDSSSLTSLSSSPLYVIVVYDSFTAKDRMIVLLNNLERQSRMQSPPMVLLHFPHLTKAGVSNLQLHLQTAQKTLSSRGEGGKILIYGEFSEGKEPSTPTKDFLTISCRFPFSLWCDIVLVIDSDYREQSSRRSHRGSTFHL